MLDSLLNKRLYVICGLEKDGRIKLIHHQFADKSNKNIKDKSGTFVLDEEISPKRRMKLSYFYVFVEGKDFEITPTGKIIKK